MTTDRIRKGEDAGVASQDEVNRRVYMAKGVDRSYRFWTLGRAEALVLLKYQPAFSGQDVLDVGVGAGRTTIYLAPLARRYEAIDYSPVMVESARSRLPGISFRVADMRDLSAFADATFDFLLASNNVLDAVSHEDRLRALAEFRRVLRDGGTLVFSSHNRQYRDAGHGPRVEFSRNPVTLALNMLKWVRQHLNHARIRGLRRLEPDYSLLDDMGMDFGCLHYDHDHETQRRQLAGLGLRLVDVLDHEGQSLVASDPGRGSPWLMYIAKREPAVKSV